MMGEGNIMEEIGEVSKSVDEISPMKNLLEAIKNLRDSYFMHYPIIDKLTKKIECEFVALEKACVIVSRKKLETATELKGNELGWILKLAENHYDSKQFREYIKKNKLEKLDNFLKLLMCKFHPNNFYPEHKETTWILIKKSELLGEKTK